MKNVKKLCAMFMLTALLSLQVMAGQIEAPPAAPAPTPPPKSAASSTSEPIANEEQADTLAGAAIQFVMSILSII